PPPPHPPPLRPHRPPPPWRPGLRRRGKVRPDPPVPARPQARLRPSDQRGGDELPLPASRPPPSRPPLRPHRLTRRTPLQFLRSKPTPVAPPRILTCLKRPSPRPG